ncbi:MAG: 6-pyruvoyl-tetrahydropterin synthase-related protein [Thermoanaerobaculaceae bacterium]|nr:6-pyruvoyl-tetrahydropterin synthase-related protein [Thermoanaerobaculaceae bacterium]
MSTRTDRAIGLGLLACALVFNGILLAPEVRIGRVPLNDAVFHLAASERLGESFARGEPFLDPWVSEWALGYPVWRSYQPLPHLLGAGVLALSPGQAAHPAWFAALQYLLVALLPASVFLGARLLGLGPAAAGLAACLALAPSGAGDFGRYGLGYGATVWRGSGLFTQLVALHLLLPGLGVVARALDGGRRRPLASLLLALTSLSHIVFGYVAFVSAGVLAVVGPRGERPRRAVRLAAVVGPALLLLAWFVVPLFLAAGTINHSRWEPPWKWDSFGAPAIVSELVSGRLLDAGRAPLLSLLVLAGAAAAALAWREPIARRLLALAGTWLALYFGRPTWGHLLLLAGVPRDMPLHRLQAAFELCAVLLAAWGVAHLVHLAWSADRRGGLAMAAIVGVALAGLGADRARYLGENAAWGEANLAAYARERGDLGAALADVRAILAERPGRVSALLAARGGSDFKVGDVPVYAFLTRAHLDEASFLYHSMSLTSDVMVLRDEASQAQETAFGVRAVITPAGAPAPPWFAKRGVHGRFAVWEASREGYFGLVDVEARYTGPAATAYEPSAAWLASRLPSLGVVVALAGGGAGLPGVERWAPLPIPPPALTAPRGRILEERKRGEVYGARVDLTRPCDVVVKITWDPGLCARVDGRAATLLRVTPGFGAIAVPAGVHDVSVRYRPGPLRPVLLVLGAGLFAACAWAQRRPRTAALEEAAAGWLDARTAGWWTPRRRAAVAVALLALIALRPLLRGRLIDGHDATEYPPRLVEFARVVSGGPLPPIWAPDLGNGYGQPLFEFAPPLVYAAALPFHAVGLGLADALQAGLLLLYAAGAAALYRFARRWEADRTASVAAAACWLFAPYLSLDLFVRAAFAEAAAVAVAPIALLGLARALDRPAPGRVLAGGAAVALVLLAHNAVALLLIPALGLFALASSVAPTLSVRRAVAGATTLVVGLGLAAFFWLPALAEKGFVKVDLLREGFLAWSHHAVYPLQLLWSRWGFGLSVAGPNDGMSFAVGAPLIVLGASGIWVLLRGRASRRLAEGVACAAAALGGALLATTWAAPVWQRVATLQYLAYPWRCLVLPALFLPLLAAVAVARLPWRWQMAVVALVVGANLAHTEPKGYLTFDDEYYAPASIAARGITTSTREEYEPKWVAVRPAPAARKLAGVTAPVEVVSSRLGPGRQEYVVRADAATDVEAATFYYPGWSARVDGARVRIWAAPGTGTIVLRVPAGTHRVVITFAATPVRRLALLLTAAVLGIAVIALAAGRLARSRRAVAHDDANAPPAHGGAR